MSDPTSIRPASPDVEQPKRRAGRLVVVRVDLPEPKAEKVIPRILDEKDKPVVQEPEACVLMHTKDHKVYVRTVYSEVLKARFCVGEKSAYFQAEVFEGEDGLIEIGERVAEEMW